MALTAYTNAVKSLLHDFNLQFYGSPFDMTGAINTARNRVAAEAQCIRILPRSTGAISSVTVTAGGSGYTTLPTIGISGNGGTGAILTPVLTGGVVTSVTVTNGGSNYALPLTLNFTGGNGTGAAATANVANINVTTSGQEVYTFASVNTIAALQPGVGQIQAVMSVAVNQGAWKPTLRYCAWGQMQAYYRSYNASILNYPEIWSQYSQGTNGSMYLYPIPSSVYSMDWDCICLPIALVDDSTIEAIPYPWTDCVPYYAAYLAYLNAQRRDDAERMLADYKQKMMEAGGFARVAINPSYYGRRQ